MKMCRNCVRFPEDGNIANHVSPVFLDDTEGKKVRLYSYPRTLHTLNYPAKTNTQYFV